MHDLNPLVAGFGLPGAMPTRLQPRSWSVAADFNWANTSLAQHTDSEALIVDGEVREARLTLTRSWSERFAIQAQIPYRYTGAGVLDDSIDDWHELFGLPEGARNQLPSDRVRLAYQRDGLLLFDARSSMSGLADVSFDVGYALASGTDSAAAAWLSFKLPTGDADRFTGSGAMDVSFALAGERRVNDSWSIFGQASVTWLGEGERLAEQQRDIAWSGVSGVSWRVWRGLELKAQLNARSAVFEETQLDFLSSAFMLTVGGSYRLDSGWLFNLAVSEDIAVETASDVAFVFGVRKAL